MKQPQFEEKHVVLSNDQGQFVSAVKKLGADQFGNPCWVYETVGPVPDGKLTVGEIFTSSSPSS